MQRSREAWVIDASVAAKWYLRDEDFLDRADHFRELAGSYETVIIAPHLSRHEVANSLASACRIGRVAWDDVARDIDSYIASGVSMESDPDWLLKAAARHAVDFTIAIYDAVYLALAEGAGMSFATADRRLHNLVRRQLPFVHWLGDL